MNKNKHIYIYLSTYNINPKNLHHNKGGLEMISNNLGDGYYFI